MSVPQAVELPPEAMRAIQEGLDDPISNLELLGLPTRVVNQLNGNGVGTLGQLMERKQEDLLEINSFGRVSLRQVFEALGRYHTLHELQQRQTNPRMRRRLDRLDG